MEADHGSGRNGLVLTGQEVADLLRVGRRVVYALVSKKAIPFKRVGRQLRFSTSAVTEWLVDGDRGTRRP
jgi:excisionase family DNA binding protein